MELPEKLKTALKFLLPKSVEEKLGLVSKPMEFKVGEGLTPEQAQKAQEVVTAKPQYPIGKVPEMTTSQAVQIVGAIGNPEKAKLIPEETKKEAIASLGMTIMGISGGLEEVGAKGILSKLKGFLSGGEKVTKKVVQKVEDKVVLPVEKLTSILNKYKPLRGTQEAAYTAERAIRFPKAEQVYKEVGGEKGFYTGLGKLKGEMPKVEVSQPLIKEVRETIQQGGIDDLFKQIQQTKWMNTGEKTTAQTGLAKALSGQIPTEGELDILQTVFGNKLVDSLKVTQPWNFSLWNVANEIGGTMKVLLSSFGDLSFYARQGIMYATRFPLKGIKLIKTGALSAVKQGYYDAIQDAIRTHDYYPLARRFNLPLTEVGGKSVKLSQVDEQFLVRWMKQIPGIGTVVKATEQAFNAMANKARMDWFVKLVDDGLKAGYDPVKNPEYFKMASKFVGSFTGRGDLGRILNQASELSNMLIYSPRLIKSKLDILVSPITYLKAPSPIRKEVWKTLISYYGFMTTILAGASIAGAEVSTDYNSTDLFKIKEGGRRWDFSGGLQPYLRIIGQVVSGTSKSSVTGKTTETTIANKLGSFLRGKLSPLASTVWDIAKGKTFLGEDITVSKLTQEHLINLMVQDVIDASKETGFLEAVVTIGVPAFFGVGTQAYKSTGTLKVKSYSKSSLGGRTFKAKNFVR